jgi:hypothetical protein
MIWGEGVKMLVTTCGGAGADYEKSNTVRMTGDAIERRHGRRMNMSKQRCTEKK